MRHRKPRSPNHEAPKPDYLQLPIGNVKKVDFSQNIPKGWRKMTIQKGRQYFQQLKQKLDQWSIVAFQVGAVVGGGYGYKFWEHYGGQCGEGFIVEDKSLSQ